MRQANPKTRGTEPARDWNGLLDRLEFILLLTALAVVVLVYPLRLNNEWLMALGQYWNQGAAKSSSWAAWTRSQFEPVVSFYFSPLILKGVLALVPLLAFTAVRVIRWILQESRPEGAATGRWIGVWAFFGWVIVSAAWSPTPRIAWTAALWAGLFGAFLLALLRRGLRPGEARGLAGMMLALGTVVMLIAYLQAVPVFGEKIFKVMYRFEDMRNRFGSLLGHNTAAASYLMMTAFPALGLMLGSRSSRWFYVYGLYLGALLFAVLVLQSRAIWVLLPILGLLALRSMLRGALPGRRLRWLPAGLLAVLTLCLLTQTIDRPWNPLYIRNNPFGERIKALSIKGLQGEARLRLNVIAATLAAQRPVFGHGLYAFQYVYPRRQAEYFARYPDSRLNQTVMRSHMVHNEYMQVLVDHGAVGLGLLGWMLGGIAVAGWRRRRELTGAQRLLHEGLGWSALGFALHALGDFPFHIPQLALPGLLCLAGWGSIRIADCGLQIADSKKEELTDDVPAGTFRPKVAARLLGVFLAALLVPLGSWPLIKALQGDVYYTHGSAYRESYYNDLRGAQMMKDEVIGESARLVLTIQGDGRLSPAAREQYQREAAQVMGALRRQVEIAPTYAVPVEITPEAKVRLMQQVRDLTDNLAREKAQGETMMQGERLLAYLTQFNDLPFSQKLYSLNQAIGKFKDALDRSPYNELIRLELAETLQRLGEEYWRLDGCFKKSPSDVTRDVELAAGAAGHARSMLNAGLKVLETAGEGIDYHQVYWLRAQIWRQLSLLDPGDRGAYEHYVQNVKQALYYCPKGAQYLAEMLRILERGQPDPARVTLMKKRLWKTDPAYFDRTYFAPALESIRRMRYALAARQMEELLRVEPEHMAWLNHAAWANLLAGNRTRARDLIAQVRRLDPLSLMRDCGFMVEKALQHNYQDMIRWFKMVPQDDPVNRAEYRAMEDEARRRLGRTTEPLIYDRPSGVGEAQWALMVAEAAPEVLLHYFEDPARARQALDARLGMNGPPPGMRFWVEGFYIGQAVKDPDLMRRCLEAGRKLHAEEPVLADLERMMKSVSEK